MRKNEYAIEIQITEDGQILSTVEGVEGSGCEALTAWLDELGKTLEHHKTKDWRKDQTRREVRHIRQ